MTGPDFIAEGTYNELSEQFPDFNIVEGWQETRKATVYITKDGETFNLLGWNRAGVRGELLDMVSKPLNPIYFFLRKGDHVAVSQRKDVFSPDFGITTDGHDFTFTSDIENPMEAVNLFLRIQGD